MKEQELKMYKRYFLTSESVTEGHPDKVCDFISDSILDACLEQDKESRVAVETLICKNKVVVAGQITSNATIDIESIVREKLKEVDYTDENINMNYRTCSVDINITKQSNDIAMGVNDGGAGDQTNADPGEYVNDQYDREGQNFDNSFHNRSTPFLLL